MSEYQELCKCGHPEDDHYTYVLVHNGKRRDQSRCKACDPMSTLGPGDYSAGEASRFAQMMESADHEFVLSPARMN